MTHLLFSKQLRRWGFHLIIWSTPSFIFAMQSEYPGYGARGGMLAAILLFILAASVLGTFFPPDTLPKKIRLASCWGARLMSIYSLLSLLIFATPAFRFLMYPEIISGVFAFQIAEVFLNSISLRQADSFLPAFLSTLVQGSFISMGALLVSMGVYLAFRIAMKPITTFRYEERAEHLENLRQ